MALNLYLHAIWGELDYPQVDQNWTDIQLTVNGLQATIDSRYATQNLTATTDPTVNDDSTQGYAPTSRWYNTVSGEWWILRDATPGAAQWAEDPQVVGNLGSAAVYDVGVLTGQVPLNDNLAAVAFSGDYDDLDNLPAIPAGEMADLDEATSAEVIAASGESGVTPDSIGGALAWFSLTSPSAGNIAVTGSDFAQAYRVMADDEELNNPTDWTLGTKLIYVAGNNATPRELTFGSSYVGMVDPITDISNTQSYLLSIVALPDIGGGVKYFVSVLEGAL